MAVQDRPDGRVRTYYLLNKRIYETQYRQVDKYGFAHMPPYSSYVKLTGSIGGEPVKLFIKEKDVCKVLEKLTKGQSDKPQFQSTISITMKKIRIPNVKKNILQPIIERSLQAVGLAA